jgi:hypothetical protein
MLRATTGMPNSTPATAIFAMLPWALDDFARVIEHSLHQTPNITIFIGGR